MQGNVQYHRQLCGKRRESDQAAQLTGHCKRAVFGAWLPIMALKEIVVVSSTVSGNRVNQASNTRLTQFKPGAEAPPTAGRVHRGLHPLSA